ncbi:MAG TPA: hypothetical protein VE970_11335 [Pseudolabrys sp.]|jgi:hypothetical protein|nr:hypothetical protein [Pseudolabrys sp.]
MPVTFFAATGHLAGHAKLLGLGAEGCSPEPFGGEATLEKFAGEGGATLHQGGARMIDFLKL